MGYQARAGMIHHRLASLYHHSYRATLQTDVDTRPGSRNKKLKQLSELHYVKATTIFTNLSMYSQAIRAILERAGLMEAFLASSKTDSSKDKVLLQILDIILEAENVIKRIVGREDDDEVNKEELDHEKKPSDNTVVKDAYATTLRYSSESKIFAKDLLQLFAHILKDRSSM